MCCHKGVCCVGCMRIEKERPRSGPTKCNVVLYLTLKLGWFALLLCKNATEGEVHHQCKKMLEEIDAGPSTQAQILRLPTISM